MIIDAHVHISEAWSSPSRVRRLLEIASSFDIRWLALSMGKTFYANPSQKQIREDNNFVLSLMRRHPDRFVGYSYLNPHHGRYALEELERCIDAGMRGVKLWIAALADDPAVFAIAERCIERDIPILQHTFIKATGNLPNESQPSHLVALAKRYPRAKLIMAHAGGNWQIGLPAVREYPNIFVDISGGDPVQGMVESAVSLLGPERVLFGSDAIGRSFASQLAKIDSANLSRKIHHMIFYENASRLLKIL